MTVEVQGPEKAQSGGFRAKPEMSLTIRSAVQVRGAIATVQDISTTNPLVLRISPRTQAVDMARFRQYLGE